MFNDTSNVSFISPEFKVVSTFAGSLTTALLIYAAGEALPVTLTTGPYGALAVVAAGAAGFGVKLLFDYLGG